MKIKSILDEKSVHKEGFLDRRFGDHYARIGTSTTRKIRSAILDVARFKFGRGKIPNEIAALSKRIKVAPQGVDDIKHIFGYEESGEWKKGSIETDPALKEYIKLYPDHWNIVVKAISLQRSVGVHACGTIISDKPIKSFIPMAPQKAAGLCTEFTANSMDGISSIEGVGGIKYDYLKLNSLRDIQLAIKLIQDRSGINLPDFIQKRGRVPKIQIVPYKGELYNIWELPEEKEVFEDVARGQTETVFQLGTSGAKKWLKYFEQKVEDDYLIKSIEDIAVFTALDRPGPLDVALSNPINGTSHNALVEYTRRAAGQKPTEDIVPIFNELFPETHGILCFQEQLASSYKELTGCTGTEAEEFRTNVGKKRKEKILAAYQPFIDRVKLKYSEETAKEIWNLYVSWAAYGFNKSHAICYALIAYVCGFLKKRFPLEWWTAVLSNADKDEIATEFWKYCYEFIDLPSIQNPKANFEIHNNRIQAPIGLLHGIGPAAQRQIARYAPYKDLRDFCEKILFHKESTGHVKQESSTVDGVTKMVKKKVLGRSSIHSGTIYSLIISGVMNSFFPKTYSTLEKLVEFETIWADVTKKKVQAVPELYQTWTAYDEFKARKELLPVYTEDLSKLMLECRHPKVINEYGRLEYKGKKLIPLYNLEELNDFTDSELEIPYGGFRIAIAGLITDIRRFTYQGNRQAMGFSVNIEGQIKEFVKWPDWTTGKLDPQILKVEPNSIGIITLHKRKQDSPFVIEDIEVL